jgi:hypothetical protein
MLLHATIASPIVLSYTPVRHRQDGAAWGLIHSAALHTDEAGLHQVHPADAVRACSQRDVQRGTEAMKNDTGRSQAQRIADTVLFGATRSAASATSSARLTRTHTQTLTPDTSRPDPDPLPHVACEGPERAGHPAGDVAGGGFRETSHIVGARSQHHTCTMHARREEEQNQRQNVMLGCICAQTPHRYTGWCSHS